MSPLSPIPERRPSAEIGDDKAGTMDRGVGPVIAPSVGWKVHSEITLLLGWGRAILLQFAHPLVACGVAEHSDFLAHRDERWRRLWRTLDAMLALTFGPAEEAARVIRTINAIHDRVHGRLQEPAGSFPAAAPYSARDPRLLRWVHATCLDSFLLTYQLYIGSLTQDEQNRYCADASGIETLLGMPSGYLPRSVAELEAYIAAMLAGGDICVTDTARALAREIVTPPLPRMARPLVWLARLPVIGLLPPSIRAGYGFRWDARREAALRLSAMAVRRILPLTPSVVRHWPLARSAFRRASPPRG
jgi:uncharacterized protein (DUF2236 family)